MESTLNAEGFESLDANMSAKSRISVSTEEELGNSMERKDADDDFGEPGFGFLKEMISRQDLVDCKLQRIAGENLYNPKY
ncbi:uncharacterized protein [Coffea arabica]|uniref:Uncharacterized protein isoform X1 n=1 Tax=Coffea arabica TaxID=13443 RepID=A0ABM4W9X0_COFAR